MPVTYEVEGLEDLRRNLRKVQDGISDLKTVHAEAAEVVEREAERLVPKVTRRLMSSIRSSAQAASGVVRAGKASVPYAGVIHFGWPKRGIRKTLYLYKAKDNKYAQVIAIYDKGVKRIVKAHF